MIGRGSAVMDFATAVNGSGMEQNPFRESRFAGINVRGNPDIPHRCEMVRSPNCFRFQMSLILFDGFHVHELRGLCLFCVWNFPKKEKRPEDSFGALGKLILEVTKIADYKVIPSPGRSPASVMNLRTRNVMPL
jgi:hypothetical protein